jgi:hypothetical protein
MTGMVQVWICPATASVLGAATSAQQRTAQQGAAAHASSSWRDGGLI